MSLDLSTLTDTAFPAYGETDWRDAVAKVLKGGSFETLRTPTLDGITIEPIYPAARNAAPIANSRGAAPWIVSQRVDHPDATEANRLALADLEGGATGLDLVFASSPQARGFGILDDTDIAALLDGVMPDLVTLQIDAGTHSPVTARALLGWAENQGITADRLDLQLIHDPIGMAARAGGSRVVLAQMLTDAGRDAAALARDLPSGTVFTADGRIYHEAGASRVETLAVMLASAITYWRALEAAGLALDDAARRIGFVLAIDQSQFSGIAEIRALRLLWSRATSAAGIDATPARIHAETSLRMMSTLDANTNLIRTTLAAFAAGIGGADSLTVLPFSAANGLADAFARRLARNAQLVLQEEANLFRVADPAAGSGRVEAETDELAVAAWELFREIEAAGGLIASLESGHLQARIAATSAARAKDIARRKLPLTGISEYPILMLPEVAVLEIQPASAPAKTLAATFPALQSRRLSEPFERLRDTAVTAAPTVFLATLGTAADFGVRATWVRNLFEVGGIAGVGGDGYKSPDDLVIAFKSSGTRAVCLASSDAIYAEQATSTLAAFKAAGAGPIFLAGRPGETFQEDSLRAAGVDVFLFAGQDVVTVLTDAQARILGSGPGH